MAPTGTPLERIGVEGIDVDILDIALRMYGELLFQHNKGANLIGPLGMSQIYEELLLDALLPAAVARPEGPVMDVGSGAGLPGIPLALAFPDVAFHLVEPRLKRTTFLSIACRRLQLGPDRVKVHRCRVEEVEALKPGEVGTMTAKAFAPPVELVALAATWVRPGGLLYLHLSELTWSDEVKAAAVAAGFAVLGEAVHPTMAGRLGVALRRAG